MTEAGTEATVLEVKNLQTVFFTNSGLFRAVDDVSFTVRRGETLAIVGESGCGKSVSALSIMRLVPDPPGRIVGGSVTLEGTDLLVVSDAEMRRIRGNRISMIFQEPMTSLNPVMRIGDQITEVVQLHRSMTNKEAWTQAVEMLRLVRIPAGISAPAFRRHAAARDDRDGAGVPAGAVDRGRADHRARRHDPGADPGADRRFAKDPRHRIDPDHP
jgi:ABC-type glutathione transport system ATPase component